MHKTNIRIDSDYGPIQYNGISANADRLYDTIDFESATLVTPDGPKDITDTEFAMSGALAWLREHIDQVEEDQEDQEDQEQWKPDSNIVDTLRDMKGV